MADEDSPPLLGANSETAPLRLPSVGPPHAGDTTCIIIPSRSLTSSLRTPVIDRSRTNSLDNYASVHATNSLPTDLNIV
jgi:hypothetical protein